MSRRQVGVTGHTGHKRGTQLMQFHQNVGSIDRVVRLIVGVALAALAVFGGLSTPLVWISAAVAAIMVITAFTGFCPLYAALRLSTRPVRR